MGVVRVYSQQVNNYAGKCEPNNDGVSLAGQDSFGALIIFFFFLFETEMMNTQLQLMSTAPGLASKEIWPWFKQNSSN